MSVNASIARACRRDHELFLIGRMLRLYTSPLRLLKELW
jgi:hypothetical protein